MFKNFLFFLDKPHQDGLMDRLEKEPIVQKYWFNMGASICLTFGMILAGSYSLLKHDTQDSPISYVVDTKAGTAKRIQPVPYPQQSLKNVSAWLLDAVSAAYALDFANYDDQIQKAGYYFTAGGYTSYLNSLIANKIGQTIKTKKLEIGVVPLQDPVLVNGGSFGSTEFWRFKIPVLVSYYGGKDPLIMKEMVEILVLRVPGYENYKGLAIAEFNMAPI